MSGLALSYSSRFLAFGFLAVSYLPPRPTFDYEAVKALSVKALGYATMGYWKFFSEDGAEKVIESHVRSGELTLMLNLAKVSLAGFFLFPLVPFRSKAMGHKSGAGRKGERMVHCRSQRGASIIYHTRCMFLP